MSETVSPKTGGTIVAFGDVVKKVTDKVDPEESGLERYVAGEHMATDDLRIRRWGEIGDDYLGPAFHMRFKPGQVLYGSRRTYLRKVALADFEGITANTTYVLESKDPEILLGEILPFIMQAETFHEHSKRESKGSVNPYVNFSDLAWYEFALPPLEEQRRIAEALQANERSIESLVQLRGCLKSLKSALELDLAIQYSSLFGSAVATHKLGEIVDVVSGHPFSSKDFESKKDALLRLIRIRDLETQAPDVCVSGNAEYPEQALIQSGEILVGMDGDFSAAKWRAEAALLNQRICCLRPKSSAIGDEDFLLALLQPVLQRTCLMTSATTVRHLSTKTIASFGIALPDVPRQQSVGKLIRAINGSIEEIGSRISQSQSIRTAITEGLKR